MSLIELIQAYAWNVKTYGRDYAKAHLIRAGVNNILIHHIAMTVTDQGDVMGADGQIWIVDRAITETESSR